MDIVETIREEIESALWADDFDSFEGPSRRKARGIYEELELLDDNSLVEEAREAGRRWAGGSPEGVEILFGGRVADALAAALIEEEED